VVREAKILSCVKESKGERWEDEGEDLEEKKERK
jgi:hypothetical protein